MQIALIAISFLAEALAQEAYSQYGSEIDIGTKGNAEHECDPDLRLSVSKRAIDYRKYANQVVIRGVDALRISYKRCSWFWNTLPNF